MSLKWFMYNLSIHEKTYSKKSVARPLNGFEPTAARKREADSDADLNPIRTRGVPIAPHDRAAVPAVSYSGWPMYRPLTVTLLKRTFQECPKTQRTRSQQRSKSPHTHTRQPACHHTGWKSENTLIQYSRYLGRRQQLSSAVVFAWLRSM